MEKQLLDLALLRKESFVREWIPLSSFFEELRQALIVETIKKNIHLSFETEVSEVWGNSGLLSHLLTNLINNAIQACKLGGEVKIKAYKMHDEICIAVRDNGRGMKQSETKRITEAFYRVDKSRSREAGGAGLGLALCSKIAEIEHIKMEFKTAPGKGTIVFLTFSTFTTS